MLKPLLIIILFLIPACLFSQVRFNKLISDGVSSTICSVIAEDDATYTLLVGTTCDGNICFEIAKCDIVGTVKWRKSYGKAGEKWFEGWENAFIKTGEGGYALVGTHYPNSDEYHKYPFIAKFNSDCDTLWVIDFEIDNAKASGFHIVQTEDMGYAIAGIIYYYTDSTNTETLAGDVLLIKTDSLGNMQWYNSYGGGTDGANKIVQTSDGGYMLGGTSLSFHSGWWPQDMYLVKTDSLGNFEWQEIYGHNSYNDPAIKDIINTSDGNYILTGAVSLFYDSNTNLSYFENRIIKINESGTTLWDKQYAVYDSYEEPDDTTYAILYSVKELKDSSLVAVGYYQIWLNGTARARSQLWKFDSNGDTLWTRTYTRDFGAENYNGFLNVLDLTSDGGFILGGRVDYDYQSPNQKIWLIKTDSLGYDYPTAIEEVLQEMGIAVYPNPSAGEFNIRLKDSGIQNNTEVEIYDMAGRKQTVNNSTHFGTFLQFDIYHLPAGIYFVRLISDSKVVASTKIVKR